MEVFGNGVRASVGEGPHWDGASRTLWQVDLTAGRVLRLDSLGEVVTSFVVGQDVGAVLPRAGGGGGLVLPIRDGVAVAGEDGDGLAITAPIEGDRPSMRMNDAKCDPMGRLFTGTVAYDFAPGAGTLYRVDADWSWRAVVDGLTISNGMGWSPDATRMYFIDSPTQGVDVFDYDVETGSLGGRRRLVDIAAEDGVPDGMTVDADGNLWVACFEGGAVRCYSPEGARLEVVSLPVRQVTSCAFGGPGLADLFITSACYGLTDEQQRAQPLAGATFVCRPGVAGLPSVPFAG